MARTPCSTAASTRNRKLGFSSGAPPVRSSTATPDVFMKSTTWLAVRALICSVRFGPAFTWQCTHDWLQR